jgi:hypothetical protein
MKRDSHFMLALTISANAVGALSHRVLGLVFPQDGS